MKTNSFTDILKQCASELQRMNHRDRYLDCETGHFLPFINALNRIEADTRLNERTRNVARELILRFSKHLPEWHPQAHRGFFSPERADSSFPPPALWAGLLLITLTGYSFHSC